MINYIYHTSYNRIYILCYILYYLIYIVYLHVIYISKTENCEDLHFDVSLHFFFLFENVTSLETKSLSQSESRIPGLLSLIMKQDFFRVRGKLSIKPSSVCCCSADTLSELNILLHHHHQSFPVYTSWQVAHSLRRSFAACPCLLTPVLR